VEAAAGGLQAISLFAAYYDEVGQLFVPGEVQELMEALEEGPGGHSILLTVVNDVLLLEGGASLKDRQLMQERFRDAPAREAHAEEILDLALAMSVHGIELDFENLGKDTGLWQDYAAFIQLMQEKSTGAGLALSVVLEPSALGRTRFPEGPQYVVMFYNLHGNHSGPGPKADLDFIKKLARDMQAHLPGTPAAAFAGGGFDWGAGRVSAVTELEAENLQTAHKAELHPDWGSGTLRFEYQKKGHRHEVWYADGTTLQKWAAAARGEGVNRFYLWLLGGNKPASLQMLMPAREGEAPGG
jgi:spore germination protein